MSFEIALTSAVLAGIALLVRTHRLSADLAAFLGLVALLVAGRIGPQEAFAGFASAPVVAVVGLSVMSAAFVRTGLPAAAGRELRRRVRGRGDSASRVGAALGGALLGAFLGPVMATAALMPAAASIARDGRCGTSRLLLPLSAGTILGGACTSIGTLANVAAATGFADRGIEPGLFAFSPAGLAALALFLGFLAVAGSRLLPCPDDGTGAEGRRSDLARVYRLHEHAFSLRIPAGSPLLGRSVEEADLGALEVQVLAIQRPDGSRFAPEPETVFRENDILILRGQLDDLRRLMGVRGVDVRETRASDLPRPAPGTTAARARLIAGSTIVGRTLRELQFRERFGVMVVGIERGGHILREHLSETTLLEGDEILALGTHEALEHFAHFPQWKIVDDGLGALQRVQDHLYLMRVHDGSPLDGLTLAESRVGELVGLTVGGIIRDGTTRLAPEPTERVHVGDRLLVTGEPWRIVKLLELGRVVSDGTEERLGAEDVAVAEVSVAPRSGAAGRNIAELSFRHRYGLEIVGVWRNGRALETTLSRIVLRLGDALLVQGPSDRIRAMADDADFVVLDAAAKPARRSRSAVVAAGALALTVGLVVSGLQPLHVAAFAGAILVVLGGAVRIDEAYRVADWRMVLAIAAFVPIAGVFDSSGTAGALADAIAGTIGRAGPYGVLAGVVVVAVVFAQALDGAPAMLLILPVAQHAAGSAGVDPMPLVVGAALAASSAMLVPSRHLSLILVTGTGGYRRNEYLRVAIPLTVIAVGTAILLVPLTFPF